MIPKFRGLSIDEKSKGEWQYGHLIEDRGRAFIISEVVEANEQYITIGSWCPVNPATLGQSTGLRDKNGKEIFEGDILKFNDEWNEYCHEGYVDGSVEGVNYVEVVKGEACFEFGKTRYPESSLFIYMEDEHLSFAELVKDKDFGFEIIDNVYENPELLEVTHE
ncbi:YopX family protein [Streptococcus pneumoniae]